jgi:putative flavoprotein involved in K+ transport
MKHSTSEKNSIGILKCMHPLLARFSDFLSEVSEMNNSINTIIIGGGQCGLSVSYYLKQHNHDHLILEKAHQPAEIWRERWDSFTLNTPNWMVTLPGAPYEGDHPDHFMTREEIVAFFEDYIERFNLPIHYGIEVQAVDSCSTGFKVTTDHGVYKTKNVVIATGFYQKPKFPTCSQNISKNIQQIHSSDYKNPSSLKKGNVLVVGSSQSGAQIAEELNQAGRTVYLSVSSAGRVPRRYRGKDVTQWEEEIGYYKRTVNQLKSPKDRFGSSAHTTGKDGGHTINLHQFARDGIKLLGRVVNAERDTITLAPTLHQNLAKADQFEAEFLKEVDQYIETHHLDIPKETVPHLTDGFDVEEISELNLLDAAIETIIWATGFSFDFNWIHFPVVDPMGCPVQWRGISRCPGLYFIGLPFLHTGISSLIAGAGADAAFIADVILSNKPIDIETKHVHSLVNI